MPEKEIPIETGAGIVTDEPCILESIGIGSSIAICLYDKKEKIAGMAHVMLGKNPGTGVNPWRFADSAIEMLLDMMEEKGAKRSDIRAKIFGGAHIFKTSTLNIGEENIKATKEKLEEEGIPIVAEDLGGAQR